MRCTDGPKRRIEGFWDIIPENGRERYMTLAKLIGTGSLIKRQLFPLKARFAKTLVHGSGARLMGEASGGGNKFKGGEQPLFSRVGQ